MTTNKARVLEALAYIDSSDNLYPPHNAVLIQEILSDALGYGNFDLANLTRTLKALVAQGLVKCSSGPIDMPGTNGFVQRWFEQQRIKYWPADLDLAAMELKYKGTPEEQELRKHNWIGRLVGLPPLTMGQFYEYQNMKNATL
jgi:hypothetical protein